VEAEAIAVTANVILDVRDMKENEERNVVQDRQRRFPGPNFSDEIDVNR